MKPEGAMGELRMWAVVILSIVAWVVLAVLGVALVVDGRVSWPGWFPGISVALLCALGLGSAGVAASLGLERRVAGRALAGIVLALLVGLSGVIWGREWLSGRGLEGPEAVRAHLGSFPHRVEEGARAYEVMLEGPDAARLSHLAALRGMLGYERLGPADRARLTAGVIEGVCARKPEACRPTVCAARLQDWRLAPEMEGALARAVEGECAGREIAVNAYERGVALARCDRLGDEGHRVRRWEDSDAVFFALLLHGLKARPEVTEAGSRALVEAVMGEVCDHSARCCRVMGCASRLLKWGDEGWARAPWSAHEGACREEALVAGIVDRYKAQCADRPVTYATGEVIALARLEKGGGVSPEVFGRVFMGVLEGICAGSVEGCCERELNLLRLMPPSDRALAREVEALAERVGAKFPRGLEGLLPEGVGGFSP